MTPFERALHDRIRAEGPITVEAYMEACNSHYYATRDPLGRAGDFTTAPEISQMFGEMVGAALADCRKRAGEPAGAVYAELGPGRGTLAADALRVMRAQGFAGDVHFVEASPVLREAQRRAEPGASWHDTIEDLPALPLLLVANEFLDALPIRQHVGGVERCLIIAGDRLAFDRDGEIVETSPSRERPWQQSPAISPTRRRRAPHRLRPREKRRGRHASGRPHSSLCAGARATRRAGFDRPRRFRGGRSGGRSNGGRSGDRSRRPGRVAHRARHRGARANPCRAPTPTVPPTSTPLSSA